FLSPGLRCYRQGQLEGRKKRISAHLRRAPTESIDEGLRSFYSRLLGVLCRPVVREGRWELLQCTPAWEGNWTWECFLAFRWQGADQEQLLVTVNFAPNQSQCYIRLPFPDLANRHWRLQDLAGDAIYHRDGNELHSRGLFLDASPWEPSIFSLTDATEYAHDQQLRGDSPQLAEANS